MRPRWLSRRLSRWLSRRLELAGPERGATLIYALFFITTLAIIVTALVSLTGTYLRTTVTQRDQAVTAAGVDGAAQIAINTLRRGSFTGGSNNCFAAGRTLAFDNLFVLPSTNGPGSAIIQCDWVSELPDDGPDGGRRTWVYMDVYVCPNAASCTTTSGRLALRFKVTMLDPSGTYQAGQRQVEVYAWSVQR